MCVFQSMKSVDNGFVRYYSHNGLMHTVGDFSLLRSYTDVPPPLKKYKEYSCALPTIIISKDIWCGLILKDHQTEEVTRSFCQLKLAKNPWSLQQPLHPRIIPFSIIKRCRHAPDMQHHLIKTCIKFTNTLNPQQVAAVDCSDQSMYALSKIVQTMGTCILEVLHIKKELLIANGHLVAGTRLEGILSDTSIHTVGLQTATVDVNHIHKAK